MNNISTMVSDGTLTVVGSIISGVAAALWALMRWTIGRFDHHDERITKLERNSVDQETFDTTVTNMYSKVEEGFRHVNIRLDTLYNLLASKN
jgi:hypothetical protein